MEVGRLALRKSLRLATPGRPPVTVLGLVGGAPGGHTAAFFVTAYFFLSRTATAAAARRGKPEPKRDLGLSFSRPPAGHDACWLTLRFSVPSAGAGSRQRREPQWQKGSQTLTKGRTERSRAPSRPHADGPTRPRAARARRASVRPCRACCEASRTRTPSCASGSTTTRATSAGRQVEESTST